MKSVINQDTTPKHPHPIQGRWLSPGEAADYLGCSKNFLDKDRTYFRRLPFTRLGRAIKYDICDLDAYMENRKVGALPAPGSAEVPGA